MSGGVYEAMLEMTSATVTERSRTLNTSRMGDSLEMAWMCTGRFRQSQAPFSRTKPAMTLPGLCFHSCLARTRPSSRNLAFKMSREVPSTDTHKWLMSNFSQLTPKRICGGIRGYPEEGCSHFYSKLSVEVVAAMVFCADSCIPLYKICVGFIVTLAVQYMQ